MSMHESYILIFGNHLENLPEIFARFDYNDVKFSGILNDWEQVREAVKFRYTGKPQTIVHKPACLINNWTVILDTEMLMVANEKACINLAKDLNTRLFGIICEGASNTYAYIYVDENRFRFYWMCDGEVFFDKGEKIPEEPDVEMINEPDLILMMEKIGASLDDVMENNNFYLYEIDESSMLPDQPKPFIKNKPWWRFW